jgi:hypothetical protein
MTINLNIERIVLEGLPVSRRNGELVANVLQTELTRLFAQHAIPASLESGAAVPVLRAGTIDPGSPIASQPLGQQIARAVHGSIAK